MASDEAHNGEDATTKKAGQSRDPFPLLWIDSSGANARASRDFFVVLPVLEKVIFCHASMSLV